MRLCAVVRRSDIGSTDEDEAIDPIQDIIVNGGEIWKGILSGGHFYAGRAENPEAIARYVTKDFWKLGPDAAVFLYA